VLSDETAGKLKSAVEDFAKGFEVRDHQLVTSEG
jgi:hypothetical protein